MQFLKTCSFWLFFILFIACKKEIKPVIIQENSSVISHAQGFDIEFFDGYTKLRIKSPYPNATTPQEYTLVPKGQKIPETLKGNPILRTPIERVVVTSTTHIPMLELLGQSSTLVGFPNTNYISSEKTRKRIETGAVKELGKEDGINTEILVELQPELLIGFSMNRDNKMYSNIQKAGIPVIFNGDWLEKTPLGRAEWIKFFGVLFDKNERADSLFQHIEKAYLNAKKIAQKAATQPTVLSGVQYKGVWNLPGGESFVAQFLKDANANYLWKDHPGKGSLSLNFETVFDLGQEAEYWIAPGHYTSYRQLADADLHYQKFDAFKKKKIYTFTLKKGVNGGAIYYEQAAIQPHLILKDLIHLFHPNLLSDYSPTFLEPLND
ncbi:ABC transporter substrate-binding protein [Flavobacteriaceae bacterium F08102]|nr:ABC transporter substrate-binding protein [Flavobacteriaceae bacterium F08102]